MMFAVHYEFFLSFEKIFSQRRTSKTCYFKKCSCLLLTWLFPRFDLMVNCGCNWGKRSLPMAGVVQCAAAGEGNCCVGPIATNWECRSTTIMLQGKVQNASVLMASEMLWWRTMKRKQKHFSRNPFEANDLASQGVLLFLIYFYHNIVNCRPTFSDFCFLVFV